MDEDMGNRLEELRKERDAHWESILQKKYARNKINLYFVCMTFKFVSSDYLKRQRTTRGRCVRQKSITVRD
jgi:hypothetical protein